MQFILAVFVIQIPDYHQLGESCGVAGPSRPKVKSAAGQKDQDTWVIRADFTTGERRWRSAKRVALSLSV